MVNHVFTHSLAIGYFEEEKVVNSTTEIKEKKRGGATTTTKLKYLAPTIREASKQLG